MSQETLASQLWNRLSLLDQFIPTGKPRSFFDHLYEVWHNILPSRFQEYCEEFRQPYPRGEKVGGIILDLIPGIRAAGLLVYDLIFLSLTLVVAPLIAICACFACLFYVLSPGLIDNKMSIVANWVIGAPLDLVFGFVLPIVGVAIARTLAFPINWYKMGSRLCAEEPKSSHDHTKRAVDSVKDSDGLVYLASQSHDDSAQQQLVDQNFGTDEKQSLLAREISSSVRRRPGF